MRGFRRKGLGFRLIAVLFFLLFFLYPNPYTLTPIHAADSTPSADIRTKLEQLKQEIASKASKLKLEISNKLTNKAYIGAVTQKSDTSLTLATKNGPKIVNINQDTDFESKIKGKKYAQKNIAEQDYLAALGDVDETGVLTARQIVLLPTPDSQVKTHLWGEIISTSDKVDTLKDKDNKTISVSLPTGSNVKNFDFVILTGILSDNTFKASYVYIIPQGEVMRPKTATGSSQSAKTAVPSASPKSTAKPSVR